MREDLVRLENVSLFIPGAKERRIVLRDLNWRVRPSGHYAVLGANGSGKSSLLKLLHGDLWPAQGRIFWSDGDGFSSSPIVARQICQLVSPALQENAQIYSGEMPALSLFGSRAWDVRERALPSKILRLLDSLDIDQLLSKNVGELSQGQLRLLLLLNALIHEPELLLLDEFTDGLDKDRREKVFQALDSLAPDMAMIFVAHHKRFIPDWCADWLEMRGGRLIFAPKSFGAENVKKACAQSPAPPQTSAPVFVLENVSVFIDRELVLKDINWTMLKGENWRITGENGSGKSTFLRLLAGDEFAANGGRCAYYPGGALDSLEILEEKRRKIRLISDLSQAMYAYPLNGLELLCSGYDNSVGLYRDFSEEEMERAESALRNFFPEDWRGIAAASIRRLSTGQLRRLYLLRVLLGNPEILLLDEPYSGLDNRAIGAFLEMLEEAGKFFEQPPQIVFVSHLDQDAPGCINREARMENGRLIIEK